MQLKIHPGYYKANKFGGPTNFRSSLSEEIRLDIPGRAIGDVVDKATHCGGILGPPK